MKNKIKIYRAVLNLTQEELADKISVTRQTINSIELGKYSPSIELAFKMAQLFKAPIEDIFIYEEDKK